MMSLFRYAAVAVSLVALTTAALAFQEQKAGGAPTAVAPEAAQSKPVELVVPSSNMGKSSVGTEVRIPGLGKLGSLPKMDFGLELLYGATEVNRPEPSGQGDAGDDLTIRGSVKHKF